jgi:hypothetical protein
MKRVLFLVTVLLLALPAAAWARRGPDLAAGPDTSRFLPRWLHASLEAGVSWMQGPHEVSNRYSAGLAFGGAFWVAPAAGVRVSAQVEYFDLPNGGNGSFGTYQRSGGQTNTTPLYNYNAFGGGHTIEGLGVVSVRAWRGVWVEGGAGHGYFASGYPKILFFDGATGEAISIPGESGWGPAYTAGAAYEFTVRRREHLYVSGRWTRLERGNVQLDFVPLRIGVRFD